jgi:hypothetical protein
VAVTQAVNDYGQLLPAVDRIEERLEKEPQQMVADAGYTTRETIEDMAERKIDFLGSLTEKEKLSRAATMNCLPSSAFVYDRERDVYVCPEGKELAYDCRHTKTKGFAYYRYEAEAVRWFAAKRVRSCWRFGRRWPARQRKHSTAAVEESWNSAMRGSKASWGCDSFTSEGW